MGETLTLTASGKNAHQARPHGSSRRITNALVLLSIVLKSLDATAAQAATSDLFGNWVVIREIETVRSRAGTKRRLKTSSGRKSNNRQDLFRWKDVHVNNPTYKRQLSVPTSFMMRIPVMAVAGRT
jgi:hypothetical protein